MKTSHCRFFAILAILTFSTGLPVSALGKPKWVAADDAQAFSVIHKAYLSGDRPRYFYRSKIALDESKRLDAAACLQRIEALRQVGFKAKGFDGLEALMIAYLDCASRPVSKDIMKVRTQAVALLRSQLTFAKSPSKKLDQRLSGYRDVYERGVKSVAVRTTLITALKVRGIANKPFSEWLELASVNQALCDLPYEVIPGTGFLIMRDRLRAISCRFLAEPSPVGDKALCNAMGVGPESDSTGSGTATPATVDRLGTSPTSGQSSDIPPGASQPGGGAGPAQMLSELHPAGLPPLDEQNGIAQLMVQIEATCGSNGGFLALPGANTLSSFTDNDCIAGAQAEIAQMREYGDHARACLGASIGHSGPSAPTSGEPQSVWGVVKDIVVGQTQGAGVSALTKLHPATAIPAAVVDISLQIASDKQREEHQAEMAEVAVSMEENRALQISSEKIAEIVITSDKREKAARQSPQPASPTPDPSAPVDPVDPQNPDPNKPDPDKPDPGGEPNPADPPPSPEGSGSGPDVGGGLDPNNEDCQALADVGFVQFDKNGIARFVGSSGLWKSLLRGSRPGSRPYVEKYDPNSAPLTAGIPSIMNCMSPEIIMDYAAQAGRGAPDVGGCDVDFGFGCGATADMIAVSNLSRPDERCGLAVRCVDQAGNATAASGIGGHICICDPAAPPDPITQDFGGPGKDGDSGRPPIPTDVAADYLGNQLIERDPRSTLDLIIEVRNLLGETP